LIFEDDIHLKGGLEMEKKKMEKKAKNMDEYKPTARQLVTIKGLHIFNLKQYCLHGKYSHLIPIAHLNKE